MKSITIIILSVMLVAIFNIAGCGEDTVTNNNTGNPNYTIGARVIEIDSMIADGDTLDNPVTGGWPIEEGYRITYNLYSNTDSVLCGYGIYNVGFDTIYYQKTHTGIDSANGNYEFIIDARSWGQIAGFNCGVYDYGYTAGQYIALRNFKIYAIDYND